MWANASLVSVYIEVTDNAILAAKLHHWVGDAATILVSAVGRSNVRRVALAIGEDS